MTQIDRTLLECMRAQAVVGLESSLSADNTKQVLDYIDHMRGIVIDLLSEKDKAQRDLKQTQYLCSVWIKAMSSVMPPHLQKTAISVAAQAIAKGMQVADMEGYDVDFQELEKQANPE